MAARGGGRRLHSSSGGACFFRASSIHELQAALAPGFDFGFGHRAEATCAVLQDGLSDAKSSAGVASEAKWNAFCSNQGG
jgi:hypothetical protein